MFNLFRGPEAKRKSLAAKAPEGPLRDFYLAPYPDRSADYAGFEYLALDIETTGLDQSKDEIVSFGWVLVRGGRVHLGESGHQLVRPTGDLKAASVVIHKIFHDHIKDAPPLDQALARVLPVLTGRVMIAHYASIETRFLDAACRRVYGTPFEIPVVDTLDMERRIMEWQGKTPGTGALRLDAARGHHNLPRYRAHNAMIDAIASAELFLAQTLKLAENKPLALRKILS